MIVNTYIIFIEQFPVFPDRVFSKGFFIKSYYYAYISVRTWVSAL
jgi:hypothetical protein